MHANAIGVVIPLAVHKREFNPGPLDHGLAIFFAQAVFDQRRDDGLVRVSFAAVVQWVHLFVGIRTSSRRWGASRYPVGAVSGA
jgi:hypothetical protein